MPTTLADICLAVFFRNDWFYGHQHMLRQAVFLFLVTVVAVFWQTWKGGKWHVIWCKRDRGNLSNMLSSTTRLSSTLPYLLFPSISYASSSSSFFSSSPFSCYTSLRRSESHQALPPLLQGPVGQALASSSPWFQNIDRF